MGDTCFLKFLEVIQHGLLEGPLVINLCISVFQVNRLRLVELVIEEVPMGEVALDKHCVVRRQLQRFQRSGDRLTRLAVEKLVPAKVAIVLSIRRIQFNRFL